MCQSSGSPHRGPEGGCSPASLPIPSTSCNVMTNELAHFSRADVWQLFGSPSQPPPTLALRKLHLPCSHAAILIDRSLEHRLYYCTTNILPDDILLRIFDFCGCEEEWQTLVHVWRRWRFLVFGTPRHWHLDLQLVCTDKKPVRRMLDIWPKFVAHCRTGVSPFRRDRGRRRGRSRAT